MSTKVKELDNRKNGNRNSCPICSPKKSRVTESQLWHWGLQNPGTKAFK